MAEYIEKHKVVNLLTALENEFQQFKPFKGFQHAMYRKLCETEIAIGKLHAADVALVEHAHGIEQEGRQVCPNCGDEHTWDDFRAAYCDCCGAKMEV